MKNILIVDDDALNRKMLSRIFEPYMDHIKVFFAENVFETQSIIINQQLDMIFMDLQIPDTDGFDFLADIIVGCPDIPVFVMTAFGTPESRAHIEKVANCHYMEKPLDIATLRELVVKELKVDTSDEIVTEKEPDSTIQAPLNYDEYKRIPDHSGIEDKSKEMIASFNKSSGDLDIATSSSKKKAVRKHADKKNEKKTSRSKRSTAVMLSNSLIKISGISAYGIFDHQDVLQTSYPEACDVIKIKPSIFKKITMELTDLLPPERLNYLVLKKKNYTRYVLFEFRNVCVVMTVNPDFHLHEFMNKLKQVECVSKN